MRALPGTRTKNVSLHNRNTTSPLSGVRVSMLNTTSPLSGVRVSMRNTTSRLSGAHLCCYMPHHGITFVCIPCPHGALTIVCLLRSQPQCMTLHVQNHTRTETSYANTMICFNLSGKSTPLLYICGSTLDSLCPPITLRHSVSFVDMRVITPVQ